MNRLELIRQYRKRIKNLQKEILDEGGFGENTDYIVGKIDMLLSVIDDLERLD